MCAARTFPRDQTLGHTRRDVDDHVRLERDRLLSVGHCPATADNTS